MAGTGRRNPGQQWLTRFDGRGFLVRPDAAAWRWGLELTAYGFPGHERTLLSPVDTGATRVEAGGSRLAYARDGNVREWFVNDERGLEHGFVIKERPVGPEAARAADGKQNLTFRMAVRGTLRAVVERDGAGVRFVDAGGAPIVNYAGLKVWDADGRELAAHFERDDAHHITLAVDERGARYPVTIDPIAQQAYIKPNSLAVQSGDQFGSSVAVSGDTVVVGAHLEDSSTTGINSTPDESAGSAGAAYVFVRSGTMWLQQAYLKPAAVGTSQGGDLFGYAVAVSGDTVIIGALLEASSMAGVNSTPNESAPGAGAAYVFTGLGHPTNTSLVALPNTARTNEDTPVEITLTGTDADDNNLTFIITAQPTKGTISAVSSPNCTAVNTCTTTLIYTPNLNYNGADSFKFKVNDGTIDSADATVSITVNTVARLSINDVSRNETNSGTTNFNFTVTLSAPTSQTVTVNYATADGTATAPADYTAIGATTLTFNAGETSKQVAVSVVGDTMVEPNETFFVNLSNPANAIINDNQGQGIIVNDDSDPMPASFTFSSTNYNAGEADARATVFVIRMGDTSAAATVDYRTQDTDTFAAGETKKTITIPVLDDGHLEGAETFQIILTSPVGAGLDTPATAVITIQDNDTAGASNPVNYSKEFFVRQQYLDFLSREPDTDGFNAWLGVLQSGNVRTMVDGFLNSVEYKLRFGQP